MVICGYLIFEFGRISAGYDLVDAGNQAQEYVDNIQALNKEIVDLKQEIAILDQFDGVICIQSNDTKTVAGWIGKDKAILAPHPAPVEKQ